MAHLSSRVRRRTMRFLSYRRPADVPHDGASAWEVPLCENEEPHAGLTMDAQETSRVLEQMPLVYRDILQRRGGLPPYRQSQSPEEVAATYGSSLEVVRALEQAARRTLKALVSTQLPKVFQSSGAVM